MMKTTALVLMMILVVGMSLAQDPPWNDKGELKTRFYCTSDYVWTPFDPSYWRDHYVNKYGEMPYVVHFTDLPDTSTIGMYFHYWYKPYSVWTAEPEDSTWWQGSFTWGELRPHLRAYRLNTETEILDTIPLPNYDLHRQLANRDTGSWHANFTFSVGSLPVPSDEVLYKFWVDPITEPIPQWRLEIDTMSIVRTARSTPADTLWWMYKNWYESIESDSLLPERMLHYFPAETRLLRYLFWDAYAEVDCQAVTLYGNRLIQVWQSDSSMYLGDRIDNFDMKQAIQDVEDRIHDICVEGVPKERTALGMAEQ